MQRNEEGESNHVLFEESMGRDVVTVGAVRTGVRRDPLAHAVATYILAKVAVGKARNKTRLYGTHLHAFTQFMKQLGIVAVEDVTPEAIRGYLAWLAETGRYNEGGIHQRYRVVRSFFLWYWKEYDVEGSNPISKVDAPRLHEKLLPPVPLSDITAMLKANEATPSVAARARNKAILLALTATGCRASELTDWDSTDLDEPTGRLTIQHSKTGKVRDVCLGNKAGRAVRGWLRHRPERATALFCGLPDGERLSYSGLREIIRRLAMRAGIQVPALHAFTRTFATEFLRSGGTMLDLQKLLGHSTLHLIIRYATRNTDDLRATISAHSPGDKVSQPSCQYDTCTLARLR